MSFSSHTHFRHEIHRSNRILLDEAGALLNEGSDDTGAGHASENDPDL